MRERHFRRELRSGSRFAIAFGMPAVLFVPTGWSWRGHSCFASAFGAKLERIFIEDVTSRHRNGGNIKFSASVSHNTAAGQRWQVVTRKCLEYAMDHLGLRSILSYLHDKNDKKFKQGFAFATNNTAGPSNRQCRCRVLTES